MHCCVHPAPVRRTNTAPLHHSCTRCACSLDGLAGPLCDQPTEMFCPNQCSGHGDCNLGFCKCHAGWFGHDCAGRVEGEEAESQEEVPRGELGSGWTECHADKWQLLCLPAVTSANTATQLCFHACYMEHASRHCGPLTLSL
jgi:hypothetical protein